MTRYNMTHAPSKKKLTAIFGVLLFLLVGAFCLYHPVFAATATPMQTVATASGLPQESIAILIARLIRVVLGVLGIITVLLVIYAGFLYMTAGGEDTKIKKAKQILTQTVIGLVIIFSSYAITTWILNKLLEAAFGTGTITSVAQKYTEPLSGSLGAGAIENHFPRRDAIGVPRNIKIFVTFKDPIALNSIIDGIDKDPNSTKLNTKSVQIFETAKGAKAALVSDAVEVTHDKDNKIFVFKPIKPIGDSSKELSYSVFLTPNIQKEKNGAAFTGIFSKGYEWNFTTSTEFDTTPPYVSFVIPQKDATEPRNITIEITFSEEIDPVASQGIQDPKNADPEKQSTFSNITTVAGEDTVSGTYAISSDYKTIDFTTFDACSEDPCGGLIYCLPGNKPIVVDVKAAPVDSNNLPQALMNGVLYNGIVDAVGNSLDGNHDGKSCGTGKDGVACPAGIANDDYVWNFQTTDEVDSTVPKIDLTSPGINGENASVKEDVKISITTRLKTTTVNSTSVSLWSDPYYQMWFSARSENKNVEKKADVFISHADFVNDVDNGWNYWPVVTNDVKSIYQICMFPSSSKNECKESSTTKKYCCEGISREKPCQLEKPDANNSILPLHPGG